MAVSRAVLAALADWDTATICNVIELFEVRSRREGYMDGRIVAAFPELPPMVGYALPASYRSAEAAVGNVYATLQEQLERLSELPGPAVLAFQDLDDPPVGATFGEVMCAVYQAWGAAGLITSGGGRDLAQVRATGFPVFQSSTICSHAYGQMMDLGRPVRIGGLVVRTGDLLHGDANGVTNVPLDIVDEIPDVAREFVAAEQELIGFARQHTERSVAAMAEQQQALASAIRHLKERVSRRPTSAG